MNSTDGGGNGGGNGGALPGGINLDALTAATSLPYPQLCGLCSHLMSSHTPDRCKVCGNATEKLHVGVRADVMACTLLHELTGMTETMMQQLAFIAKGQVKIVEVLERLAPDPKKPHILAPRAM